MDLKTFMESYKAGQETITELTKKIDDLTSKVDEQAKVITGLSSTKTDTDDDKDKDKDKDKEDELEVTPEELKELEEQLKDM